MLENNKMKLITNETKLFFYIDSDFKNWNVDEGVKTKVKKLEVKIQEKDFAFKDVFNTETDCVSQEQVIDLVKKNKNTLEKYICYFFLLKNSKGEFFVARVAVVGGGSLDVYADRFECDYVWDAAYRYRVVVPQLDSKTLSTLTLGNLDSLKLQPLIAELETLIAKYK